jgi:hypothetical protein
VAADAGNALNDTNRNNNVGVSSVSEVDLAQAVDLTVGAVSINQGGATQTGSVTVTYTVDNLAAVPATGSWTDAVYLSSDGTWNIDDPLLGYVEHDGGVAAGGSYTGSLTATPPVGIGQLSGDRQNECLRQPA